MRYITKENQETLTQISQKNKEYADKVAFSVLGPAPQQCAQLTFAALDLRAREVAARLRRLAEPGDRVLLFFAPGLDYVVAFFACVYAGLVAVPLYPPRRKRDERVAAVVADCCPAIALTEAALRPKVAEALGGRGPAICDIEGDGGAETVFHLHPADPDDLVFLQYTSGSTGTPKGVKVTHRCLLANQAAIAGAFATGPEDICLNWLPLYHDMGLIGTVLHPVYMGCQSVLMNAGQFMREPVLWLREIGRHRATLCGAPNFAYEHILRRLSPADLKGLDLSSWRVAFNGAEPVRARTLDTFAAALAPCGFRREALFPCYGMAEATLFIAGGKPGAMAVTRRFDKAALAQGRAVPAAEDARSLVSCGAPQAGHRLRIVDPESRRPLPDGQVGEIWFSGPSVAAGYWEQAEQTEFHFNARIEGDESDPWLRTGDLGFLDDEALFITGRLKDLLIFNGLNHYPQDIEQAVAASHPALSPDAGAAFAVEGPDGDLLVVVNEVDRTALRDLDGAAVSQAVRILIAQRQQLAVAAVVLLMPGSLPRTSSGKVRRHMCRERYLAGGLDAVYVSSLSQDLADSDDAFVGDELTAIVARALAIEAQAIDAHKPLITYGLSSLPAMEIVDFFQRSSGIDLAIEYLFEEATLASLQGLLEKGPSSREPIVEPPAPRVFPQSHNQRTLWFLHQLQPQDSAYNLAYPLKFAGSPDPRQLQQALIALIQRHPALRTSYGEDEAGMPVQTVHEQAGFKLAVVDASDWPGARIGEFLRNEAERPFDLATGPVIRAFFLQRARDPILLLVVHHIAVDLQSFQVMVGDLACLLEERQPLAPAPHYHRYVRAQQRFLDAEAGQKAAAFWTTKLEGAATLDLPLDGARQVGKSQRGRELSFHLEADLAGRLECLARQRGRTLFSLLMAAYQTLLQRYSGQNDLVVGFPAADRPAGLSDLVGYCVNLLPLRSRIPADATFAAFWDQVHQQAGQALDQRGFPFGLMVEKLQRERDPGRHPLFQAAFALQMPGRVDGLGGLSIRRAGARMALAGLAVEALALPLRAVPFDLTLTLAADEQGLSGTWQYAADLFHDATAERQLRHFLNLLTSVAAEPDQKLSEIEFMEAGERRSVLETWNRPETFPVETCLDTWFRVVAQSQQEAVALVCEDVRLGMGELDRASNRMAHALRALGAGPETIVGLCLRRSPEMVIAILATLKAGAAYLPLNPEEPGLRLTMLLQDANVAILVAENSEDFPEYAGAFLDPLARDLHAMPDTPPLLVRQPDNAAYVIYTSGSTGRPKGVVITHAQVIRLFRSTDAWFSFNRDDVWTLFHNYFFDFSVWELWGPLLYGGRLVVVPHWTVRSPGAFRDLLFSEGVTILNQTPSAFRQLVPVILEDPNAEEKLRLREIIFGGEALDLAMLVPWISRFGDSRPRLVNMYGITETTVHITFRPILKQDLARPRAPIGVRLPDARLLVLDARFRPVPPGIRGELCIGGAAPARGYLNRPDLTATRFVPDPFGDPGSRLYRSGDLGRFLADGDLEHHGRMDQQVKINGYRIELGEIEAALLAHPAIRDAVVLPVAHTSVDRRIGMAAVQGDADGQRLTPLRAFLRRPAPDRNQETRLAGWLVPEPGEPAPSVEGLRRFLGERLPAHMIPAFFVTLDDLPLTPNGKLDRAALPDPRRARPDLEAGYTPPADEKEHLLQAIWSQVLGLDRVGVTDDFFDLGGDSIRSIQVRSLAARQGLEFSLERMYLSRTIRNLAAETRIEAAHQPVSLTSPLQLVNARDRAALPAGIVDAYPLCRLQSGVLFHSMQQPQSPMYREIFFYHLRAPLDLDLMRRVLDELVARHPILRTSFDLTEFSEPMQLVHERVTVPLQIEDWRSLSREQQRKALPRWIEQEKHRPWDWRQPPLVGFSLHRLCEQTFYFVMSFHDAVSDGWSDTVLLTEVLRHYDALLGQRDLALTPPKCSYRDFVALEREVIRSEPCREFWQANLENCTFTAVPRLPSHDRPGKTPRISVCNVEIPRQLSDELKNLARRTSVTTRHVLLASHMWVLRFLSGQEDVLTGLESNGRLEGLDGDRVLGVHLNIVPFRMLLTNGSWLDCLRQTYRDEQAVFPNRRFPLAELQKGRAGQALLEINFNYTHFHLFRDLEALQHLEILGAEGFGQTHFTLAAEFNQDPFTGDINLDLIGNLAEISEAQLVTYGGYYLRCLEAMATHPETGHHHFLPFDAEERGRILEAWNRTERAYPSRCCIHQLVNDRVASTSEAVALIFGEQTWTYRQAAEQSERLAAHLRHFGIRPGDLVGLCFDASPRMIFAILGVLRAGAAWLPLEPSYPAQRLGWMLEDAEVALILASAETRQVLPACRVPIIEVETLESGESQGILPEIDIDPDMPAYVLFTSGSTGRPKGVPISHRNLFNCTRSRDFYREPVERFILLCPFSFDLSVGVIFWTIRDGGALVLPEEGERRDVWRLAELLVRRQVTHWLSVPALYKQVLDNIEPAQLTGLKLVVNGGEAPPADLIEAHFRLLPGTAFVNEYGPTEATIWSTARYCEAADPGRAISIGQPIDNTQVFILDPWLRAVAPGVPGQLHIGGDGLSTGYLGRPALTAEQFIPCPHGSRPGARVYRTGDLARFLEDGRIEHLGRLDHQVKIRGYRIELAEIELALKTHANIADAVVVARSHVHGALSLTGYLVPVDGSQETLTRLETNALRTFLGRSLADYMIPTHLVLLQAMPRTPNGKIDRKSLPEPGRDPLVERAFVAPETQAERAIASIWAEELGLARVGLHDNFFEIGGDSIHCIRIVAKANKAGLAVRVADLFERPTVAGLAALADATTGPPASLPRVSRAHPLPLSFSQRRLWFLTRMDMDPAIFHIPGAVAVSGECRIEVLRDSLGDLVRRHEILRTQFVENDGEPVQRIVDWIEPAFQVLDLNGMEAAVQAATGADLLQQLVNQPFDLAVGPLLRVCLVRLAPRRFKVLLCMHHIISDAWSAAILLREWAVLYQARLRRQPDPLPALDIQYADFAHWQDSWMRSAELPRLIAWWKAFLVAAPPLLELPYDRPRPALRTTRGNLVDFRLDAAVRTRLMEMAAAHEASLFMLLQTLFLSLLHRYGAGEDLVLGTPVANREQVQTQTLLGFFVNTVLLRGRPSPQMSFRDFLHQIRDASRQSFAHQALPFDRLVEELRPERSLAHHPVFQVMLVLQNVPLGDPQLPDVTLVPETVRNLPTEFDLVLEFETVEGDLRGMIRFSEDLFERTSIEAMADRFKRLTADALEHPHKTLAALDLLSEASRRQIWREGCGAMTAGPVPSRIHDLLLDPAMAEAPSPALVDSRSGTIWSYADLHGSVDRLAAHLQHSGVGPETPVAICDQHGPVFALAILAVLRAGGAFVPLDPEQPPERLTRMIADSGARLVLTRRNHAALPALQTCERVLLDERGLPANASSAGHSTDGADPDQIAYIMYTSGSTGKPKGIAVSHRAMVNRLLWARAAFPMTAADRFLHLASFSFDISLWELAAPLMGGGVAVMAAAEARGDMAAMKNLIQSERITAAHFVPSLLQAYLTEVGGAPNALPNRLFFGGEVMPASLLRQLSAFPRVALHQFYGPTEAAINVTCLAGCEGPEGSIGGPISGVRVHVRDSLLDLAPVGIPGQICIGGSALARGYLGNPGLTAERFVPEPLGDEPGARLYLTGDRAKRLVGGQIAFLGRLDEQLKLRGHRIEPGEVEAALLAQPGIEQALAMSCADGAGELRLVAFVRVGKNALPEWPELRAALAERLPEFMMPFRCLQLAQFPLNANHKLDRAALRALVQDDAAEVRVRQLPRTPLEARIAAIWSEMLGCGEVDIHDNFFHLGGHSLLGTKILSRLRRELGVALSLRYVFEEPTVAGLAARIEKLAKLMDHVNQELGQETDQEEEVLI